MQCNYWQPSTSEDDNAENVLDLNSTRQTIKPIEEMKISPSPKFDPLSNIQSI